MNIKSRFFAVAVLAAALLPAGADAASFNHKYEPTADYEKSVVLDTNGNSVKTATGQCVTHNFQDPGAAIGECESIGNIVYFDLGSAVIKAEGKKVIAKVADRVKNSDKKVVLSGHTDRSASAAFNDKLSQKRVAAVKAALVKKGVASSSISTAAQGEEDNAVPTKDGVVEKLNRRVEIDIVR